MFNRIIPIVFIASYPLLVHLSVVLATPRLQFIAPIIFLLGACWYGLWTKRALAWLTFIGLSGVILLLEHLGLTLYLLYLPPVVIPLLLLFIFGRTLFAGKEPLITAIGEAARGPLTESMRRYTRRLTQLWCVVFLVLMLWSMFLILIKQPELWSWFTNVINYGVVSVLFVGEFILRKKLFPTHNHPGFIEYLRIIATSNIRY